jgi:hypothetical protein
LYSAEIETLYVPPKNTYKKKQRRPPSKKKKRGKNQSPRDGISALPSCKMRATEKEPFIKQTQSRLVMHEIRGKHPTTATISPAIAVNTLYKVLCDTVYGFYMSRQNDRWYAKKERQNNG